MFTVKITISTCVNISWKFILFWSQMSWMKYAPMNPVKESAIKLIFQILSNRKILLYLVGPHTKIFKPYFHKSFSTI